MMLQFYIRKAKITYKLSIVLMDMQTQRVLSWPSVLFLFTPFSFRCCYRLIDPWLGSTMFSSGEQGWRGSAVCTKETLQVTGSTRTSHHAGKSTGRCTLVS